MLIRDLINQLEQLTDHEDSASLVDLIHSWQRNEQPLQALNEGVRYYFDSHEDKDSRAWLLWRRFEDHSIAGVDGMTMNERLFVFGLLDRWDNCYTRDQKLVLYAKVNATP